MTQSREEKLVFGISKDASGGAILLIGIPRGAYEYMKDGQTNNFDLEPAIGLPLKVILYGAPTHAEAFKVIDQHNKNVGLPYFDQRNRDFTIKEKS